ncbi:MAG: hypothetical protein BRC36_00405 [Cyanobacteria bacterium QH_2_48_84]|nr:MAG: hypothetical protein BRC36_00405 [Cyanobacteria bacterium QH_2_48_84]
MQRPRLPIPPPLRMSEPGSFAYHTLTQRWPAIAQQVITDNDFPPEIVEALEALMEELPDGKVRSLQDQNAPDAAAWRDYLQPFLGQSWLEMPWYFAESYFYRRILEATRYFLPGAGQGVDPFANKKRAGLATALDRLQATSNQVNQIHHANLDSLIYRGLWGNQADLSLQPRRTYSNTETNADYILVDDTSLVLDRIANLQDSRIDFISDNAGSELLCDLYLVDFLLSSNAVSTFHFHLKPHPTFVSDATLADLHHTLEVLATDTDSNLNSWAQRLESYISSGQLQLREDFFWTAPLVFWEMPPSLRQDISEASLVFLKGDANYRRLLGDRHWQSTTAFEDIVCYFPAPFVVLRTLKSEVAAGLKQDQLDWVTQEDPQWLTDGQWGMIQFAQP